MAEERSGELTPRPVDATEVEGPSKNIKKKRSFFSLVKKKASSSKASGSNAGSPKGSPKDSPTNTPPLSREPSKLSSTNQAAVSPSRHEHHLHLGSSPNQLSPGVSSPATSQIFERDVQDSTVLPPTSPAIPAHIQTEDHIPPVLDDASEAITNRKLDPDAVEIVTHNVHQPASLTVPGGFSALNSPLESTASDWAEELTSFANRQTTMPTDGASNYGSLESPDVRRLSFISFADVVQAEHGGMSSGPGSRDSIHFTGLKSINSEINRLPSPVRSPVSSPGLGTSQELGTSPPTSNPASIKGLDMSPSRKPLGSPVSGTHGVTLSPPGDLNIETMAQALRRTGSMELNALRSIPTSPVGGPGSK